ncbi:MAG: hypothetical protein ACXVII_40980 [Solirubrobacteraceae bacterium]
MEAIVADVLGARDDDGAPPIELVTANSTVVFDLVSDGRADLGVATAPADDPGRPRCTHRDARR